MKAKKVWRLLEEEALMNNVLKEYTLDSEFGSSRILGRFNHVRPEFGWHFPRHIQSALNYYCQRPEDEGKVVIDCSFILKWETQIGEFELH